LAFAFAAATAPGFATDLKPPHGAHSDDRLHSGPAHEEIDVAEFCYEQRRICRKVCDLHSNFNDRFDGCPQSCDSRETRCNSTACFRWTEPDFLIAERFGGFRCAR
jgi:hypothetical protein